MNSAEYNILKVIIKRRSVRRFIDKNVEDKKIEILKEVVFLSPTFKNNKNYKFIFVKDLQLKKEFIRAATSGIQGKINLWLFGCNAPLFIVATGNPNLSLNKDDKKFYLFDTSFAMENFVLAACELGLGTCWIGAFDEERIKKLLNIPKNIRVAAISPLGYPQESKIFQSNFSSIYDITLKRIMHKRRKNLNEILHYNSYGNKIENDFISEVEILNDEIQSKESCIINGLKNRKYNLNFSDKEIDKEKLFIMFEAGRLAPSASNSQIWRYVLIDENNKIKKLINLLKEYQEYKVKPQSIICACAESWIIKRRGFEQPYFLIDVPISISHITLMANASNLSWDLIFDFDEVKIREILNIPKSVKIISLVPLGYSSPKGKLSVENFQFYNKPSVKENIFYLNKWENN